MTRRRGGAALGAVLAAALTVGVVAPPTALAAPPEVGTESSTMGPDGAVLLHAGPVRLRRGTQWQPIDLTLVAGPDGTVRPVAVAHDLLLTRAGPVVTFAGGGSAALEWSGRLPSPRLDGNRATYPQALAGHDLVVEATRAGFAASLRRTDPAAAPAPPLSLRRTTAEGAAMESAATDTAATDTGVEPATLVEADSAVSRVVAAAPPAGQLPVPFDTTVQSSVLRSDLSGDPDLRLGSYDGTTVARSLLTFDLAPLAGRAVASARLFVHQDWSASCRARGWEVWTAPPAGPGTRWAEQPVADRRWATSTETRGRGACAAGWTGVDATELVRSWVATGAPAGSVQLRASDEGDPLGWKRLASAESPHPPHLEIKLE